MKNKSYFPASLIGMNLKGVTNRKHHNKNKKSVEGKHVDNDQYGSLGKLTTEVVIGSIARWAWTQAVPLVRDTLRRQFISSVIIDPKSSIAGKELIDFLEKETKILVNFTNTKLVKDDLLPNSGTCVFKWKSHTFWIEATKFSYLEADDDYNLGFQARLSTLGRSSAPLQDLLNSAVDYHDSDETILTIYTKGNYSTLAVAAEVSARPLETVILSDELKESVVETIRTWTKSREWYKSRFFPYAKAFIFHGPPGTGKSSLVRSLAVEFNFRLVTVSLSSFDDESLVEFMRRLPKHTMVVFDDFDTMLVENREDEDGGSTSYRKGNGEDEDVTLKGLLEALDGIVPLDGIISIFMTNHLKNLDPALVRPGRINNIVEIGPLGDKEIKTFISMRYGQSFISDAAVYSPTRGCILQEAYSKYPESTAKDFEGFVEYIESHELPEYRTASLPQDSVTLV